MGGQTKWDPLGIRTQLSNGTETAVEEPTPVSGGEDDPLGLRAALKKKGRTEKNQDSGSDSSEQPSGDSAPPVEMAGEDLVSPSGSPISDLQKQIETAKDKNIEEVQSSKTPDISSYGIKPLAPTKVFPSGQGIGEIGLDKIKQSAAKAKESEDFLFNQNLKFNESLKKSIADVSKEDAIVKADKIITSQIGKPSKLEIESNKEQFQDRTKTEQRIDEEQRIAKDTGQGRFSSGAAELYRSSVGAIPEILKGMAILASGGEDVTNDSFVKVMDWASDQVKQTFPTNPKFQGEVLTETLPSTAGTLLSFMIGGALGKTIKIGELGLPKAAQVLMQKTAEHIPVAFQAGFQTAATEYQRSLEATGNPETALETFYMDLPSGLPFLVAPTFKVFNKLTDGALKYGMKQGIEGGITGFIQMASMSWIQNLSAQQTYDKTRNLLDGVMGAGGSGFALNGVITGLIKALTHKAVGATPAERAKYEQAIEYIQEKQNKIKDVGNTDYYTEPGEKGLREEPGMFHKSDAEVITDQKNAVTGTDDKVNIEKAAEVIQKKINKTPEEGVANDRKNEQGAPGQERIGQEPIKAEPDQGGGNETPGASGVVQTPSGAEKVKPFQLDNQDTFYHASARKRNGRLTTNTAQQFGEGVYFSTDHAKVKEEFGDNVSEVKLTIENPVYTSTTEWHEVEQLALKKSSESRPGNKGKKSTDEDYHIDEDISEIKAKHISDAAKELGYDAIIQKGAEYGNEINVLDESKIIYPDETIKPEPTGEVGGPAKPAETPKEAPLPVQEEPQGKAKKVSEPKESKPKLQIEAEARVGKAEEALKAANDEFKAKKEKLGKSMAEDQLDLMGNRIGDKDNPLKLEHGGANRGQAKKQLDQARVKIDKAKVELERAKKAVPKAIQAAKQQTDAFKNQSSEQDISKITDPIEIARRYDEESRNPSVITPSDQAIANILQGKKLNTKSVARFGDMTDVSKRIRDSYFHKEPGKGTNLDQIAQEASEALTGDYSSEKVTPDDVWEFMNNNQGGAHTIYTTEGNHILQDLNQRHIELTSKGITAKGARTRVVKAGKIVEKQGAEDNFERALAQFSDENGTIDYEKAKEFLSSPSADFYKSIYELSDAQFETLKKHVDEQATGAQKQGTGISADDRGRAEQADPTDQTGAGGRKLAEDIEGKIRSLRESQDPVEREKIEDEIIEATGKHLLNREGVIVGENASFADHTSDSFFDLLDSGKSVYLLDPDAKIAQTPEDYAKINDALQGFPNEWEPVPLVEGSMMFDDAFAGGAVDTAKELGYDAIRLREIDGSTGTLQVLNFDKLTHVTGEDFVKPKQTKRPEATPNERVAEGDRVPPEAGTQPRPPVDLKKPSGVDQAKVQLIERLKNVKGKYGQLQKKGLGVAWDPEKRARELYEFHRELVGLAKDSIKLGVESVKEFAEVLGRNVDKFMTRAFQDAKNELEGKPVEVQSEDYFNEKAKPGQISGIKKALVPEEKVVEMKDSLEKRTNEEILAQGKKDVDSGDIDPVALVNDVVDHHRALQTNEVAALVYYKAKLDNSLNAVNHRIVKNRTEGGDSAELSLALQESKLLTAARDQYHEMQLVSAREQSRAFGLRKMLLDNQYDLQQQINEYRAIDKDGEIPPEVMKYFKELDETVKKANARIAELENKLKERGEKGIMDTFKDEAKKERKGPTRPKRGKDLIAEGVDDLAQALGITKMAHGGPKISAVKAIEKIGRGMIDEGLATLENIGKKLKEYLDEKFGGKIKFEDYEKEVVERIIAGMPKASVKDGKLKIPKSMIYDLVESGIDNIEDLTKAIHEMVKKDIPEITERQVRDSITEYGKTLNLNKDEIATKIRGMKRVGRLISQLEDVRRKIRPLRSGLQRDALSDRERTMQRELKEELKDLPEDAEHSAKVWKTAIEGVKTRLRNQITDLEEQIKTGKKTPQKKGIKYDDEALVLQAKRDELREILQSIEGKPELSDEQRLRQAVTAAEKSLKDYERMVKEGDFEAKQKPKKLTSPELESIRAKRDATKEQYEKIKEELGIADKQRLEKAKESVKRSTEGYRRRLSAGDFSKREKPNTLIEDKELENAILDRERAKFEFDVAQEKNRLANRDKGEKVKDFLIDAFNIPKSLISSVDLSAPLRQGFLLSVAHPGSARKAFVQMFRQMASKKYHQDWLHKLHQSDVFPTMRASKLYIAEEHAKLTAREENFVSHIINRVPVIGKLVSGSERAYSGYLNALRADVFAKGVDQLKDAGYTLQNNKKAFQDWASFINNASGRGNLGALERAAPILNTVLFSPRFLASRLNLMNPRTYYKMDPKVRLMAMKDTLTYIGFGMTVLGLAAAAGAEVEQDPRSTDFGKIKVGNIRYDIWAGFQPIVRLLAQIAPKFLGGGRIKTASGDIKELNSGLWGEQTRADVVGRFARSKEAPTVSALHNLAVGTNIIGEKVTPLGELERNVMPLYIQDILSIYKSEGVAGAAAVAVPGVFGIGVQSYKPKQKSYKQIIRDALDKSKEGIPTKREIQKIIENP